MKTDRYREMSTGAVVSPMGLFAIGLCLAFAGACSPTPPTSSEDRQVSETAADERNSGHVVDEQLADEGEAEASSTCIEGMDCCAEDSDCVATQFRGCCAGDSEVPPCEWYATRVDDLEERKQQCAVGECSYGAIPPCDEGSAETRDAACLDGRCTLVPAP